MVVLTKLNIQETADRWLNIKQRLDKEIEIINWNQAEITQLKNKINEIKDIIEGTHSID